MEEPRADIRGQTFRGQKISPVSASPPLQRPPLEDIRIANGQRQSHLTEGGSVRSIGDDRTPAQGAVETGFGTING